MPPFAAFAPLIGQGISALGSMWSGAKDRAFAERMSSTAYQRAVQDMERAGLNPLMMYGGGAGGAASTPTPRQENPFEGAGKAFGEAALIKKQLELLDNQAYSARQQGIKASADASYTNTLNQIEVDKWGVSGKEQVAALRAGAQNEKILSDYERDLYQSLFKIGRGETDDVDWGRIILFLLSKGTSLIRPR